MENYDDIIHLSRPKSKHPRMSLYQRSAQFAPFAALTGYEGHIKETARLTDRKIEIDEEIKKELDVKIMTIKNKLNSKPNVTITYFIPNVKKNGGRYETISKKIKRIDEKNYELVFDDNTIIQTKNIYNIEF